MLNFFLIKMLYYLRVLSITPELCITKMHTTEQIRLTREIKKRSKTSSPHGNYKNA
jgi:hypothetical protein